MDIKRTVIDALKWLSMARLLAQITRWCVTFIVIKLLSPSDYGVAALAQTVLALLELFTSLGLGAAVVQSKNISKRDLQIIFGMIVTINTILLIFLWVIAPIVSQFYDNPALELILKVLSLNFVFIVLGSLPSSLLLRDMKFKAIALSEVISGFCGAGVSLALAYAGYGYWALVLGGMSIIISRTIVQFIANPVLIMPRFNFSEAKHFISFGGLIMASIIVRYLYVSLDVVIAGRVWTPETLGMYAVALQLAVLPLNKIMPMIRQVAFPAYSKTQSDPAKVRSYVVESMGLAMALAFPLFFGISSIASLLVPLLLGIKWQAATLPITLLCMVIPFRMMLELFEPALNATGNPRVVFNTSLRILMFMVPTFLISVRWDEVGLALGWLVVFPLLSLYSCSGYCRELKIPFMTMLRAIKSPVLCSSLMLVSVTFYIQQLESSMPQWTLLISAIALGGMLYVLLIFISSRSLFNRYKSVLQRR
ncbi:MAG: hypothetical protein COA96_03555 [SAR86 cluster bacterium]|uniref:Uncharacterized protein n=1 Tax=SAR86 cluster bacterium TaxID=2030880 RepID=A0A2A5B6Z4_9GAMM|nr:MAG: hypothetical protein COA96_03555 [SAR86 cluster bacterium]